MINWKEYSVAMQESVTSTLENITFSLVEECFNEQDIKYLPMSSSELEVSLADISYTVTISLPTEFLDDLISTLYPGADGNKDVYISDTLNELNNTVCGAFFRGLESKLGSFTLGLPDMLGSDNRTDIHTYVFLIDDQYKLTVLIRE